MIVIYAEKASLAKAIAVALKAGNRIAHPKEPVQCLHSQFTSGKLLTSNNSIPYQNKIGSGGSPVGHYEFIFNGEKAIICHGVGHLCGLADRTAYGDQYKNWDLSIYPCIPDSYQIAVKTDTKTCFDYVKGFFDKADLIINATDPDREGELIFAYIIRLLFRLWSRKSVIGIRLLFHLLIQKSMYLTKIHFPARSVVQRSSGVNSAISVLQRKMQAVLSLSAMRFAEKLFPMHRL